MADFNAMKQALEELEQFLDEAEAREMAEGPGMEMEGMEADASGGGSSMPPTVEAASPSEGMCPTCKKPYGPGHPKH
jgi:hypothetical protein